MSWLKTDRIAFALFILALAFFAFLYGVAVGRYKLFPYNFLDQAHDELTQVLFGVPHKMHPVRYEETGVKIYDRDAMAPGVTLITSHWSDDDWMAGIRLIDADGNVLHRWRTNPAEIWPTSPHKDHQAGWFNGPDGFVHGSYLFDNGDVLFNIEFAGLVRMNAAGKVLWTLPYRTHHSVFRDEDGYFWVCGIRWVEDDAEGRKRAADFPGLRLPFTDGRLLKVSADGKILKDISATDILYRSGNQHLIWKVAKRTTNDVLHLNDVEVLSREMADQYPTFEAGDLVFSLKFPHFVGVVHPETEELKWSASGPFLSQHDPHFIGDGWIGIFDNRFDSTDDGRILGGSRIVALKPQTDEVRLVYQRSGSKGFYTQTGGMWQQLDNGNLLITEAMAGRIFEVDPEGRLVWEWFQEHYDDEYVLEVMEGTRYDYTAQQVAIWSAEDSK